MDNFFDTVQNQFVEMIRHIYRGVFSGGLFLLSTCYDIYHVLATLNYRLLSCITDEFTMMGHMWVFRNEDSTNFIPSVLPLKVFNKTPLNASWYYNKYLNLLHESSTRFDPTFLLNLKLPWMMTILDEYVEKPAGEDDIICREYFLDDFVSSFTLVLKENKFIMTPKLFLNTWSISTGIWPENTYNNSKWRLQVVDKNGDSHIFDDLFNSELSKEKLSEWLSLCNWPENWPENKNDFSDTEENDDEVNNEDGYVTEIEHPD